MNIGIDLDNTLVNTHKKMLDYIYSDEQVTSWQEFIELLKEIR